MVKNDKNPKMVVNFVLPLPPMIMMVVTMSMLLAHLQVAAVTFKNCTAPQSDSGDSNPVSEFIANCKLVCDQGHCLQDDSITDDEDESLDNRFCVCPQTCKSPATIPKDDELHTSEERDKRDLKVAKCFSNCNTNYGTGTTKENFCFPPGKTSFMSEAICTCPEETEAAEETQTRPVKRTKCTKKYRQACTSICQETGTCRRKKSGTRHCACSETNPSKSGDEYSCKKSPLKSMSKMEVKKCRDQCQAEDDEATPFFCQVNANGKRYGMPEFVCACGQ